MYSSPFRLRTFLHSNLHFPLINFLLSALLSPTIILTGLFFAKLEPPDISLLVPSSLVHVCLGTHEPSTFPLRLRDKRLSPITPSTFLQAFAPAVTLIVAKAINLVDFALGKCHLLS